MTDMVIKVSGVSKRYRVGVREKADTAAQRLQHILLYPIHNYRRITSLKAFKSDDDPSVFWALKDINFEVSQGEVMGIIGRNGAGKSTLLKILSKITEPTTGEIRIRGRVSSLLEVGTGFHPELTGRDNVYMNGTILGMSKQEVDRKFDAIVDFSGVEQYIDTPVKFYSSGMKVRLAFSVAAHLEPQVLVIDEVLAVGDFEFQKKCLGKMEDVAGQGRTVLFVSHNMTAVRNLCTRAIQLSSGQIAFSGSVNDAVDHYLADYDTNLVQQLDAREDRSGSGRIKFINASLQSVNFEQANFMQSGDQVDFKMELTVASPSNNVSFAIIVSDNTGGALFTLHTRMVNKSYNMNEGSNSIACRVNDLNLAQGVYRVTLRGIYDGSSGGSGAELADHIENAFTFEVSSGNFYKTGQEITPSKHGSWLLRYSWE